MLTDNLLLLLVRDLLVVYCKVSNAPVLFRFELTFLPVAAIKSALCICRITLTYALGAILIVLQ